ncbi:MAG: Crp/Fnr family transcriptional regulator [Erythrobacter sp.]|jgi:CRP/FNR family transcriptional regulator|nr:Crp/Fnr family transcriptional regulator [Erythrobacter sp.]
MATAFITSATDGDTSGEAAAMAAFCASVNGLADTGMAATLDRLCAVGEFCIIAKGSALAEDPDKDRLVFLAMGAAKLVTRSLSSRLLAGVSCTDSTPPESYHSHILAFCLPGEMISVLRQTDANFHLVALTPLELVVFDANSFLDIAQENPAVIRQVLSRSLQALHRSRTRMIQLGHKSARQRIADFLVSIAGRVCGCTEGRCEFALPMSRRDIGDSLGLTIETVSRQFTDLRDDGLIETRGRSGVVLTDIAALVQEAGRTSQLT